MSTDREAVLQLHRLCIPNGHIWSRRSSYWLSRSRPPVFYFWLEHLSCFHR